MTRRVVDQIALAEGDTERDLNAILTVVSGEPEPEAVIEDPDPNQTVVLVYVDRQVATTTVDDRSEIVIDYFGLGHVDGCR